MSLRMAIFFLLASVFSKRASEHMTVHSLDLPFSRQNGTCPLACCALP